MTRVTCAISGIRFQCSYFENLNIPHTEGFIHPIFAAPYSILHNLYTKHTKGYLTSNDSYLLFCAFLHSSDKIKWKHPAICNPNEQRTKQLIENNLAQLIEVLEKSACIKYPAFSQPRFVVNFNNADLSVIPNWIKAWEDNIEVFMSGRNRMLYLEDVQKVENRLSKLILSGEKPEKFSHVIADWANKAAEFPTDKVDLWCKTIRSCFSITKMFNTPLTLLKEIKEYCECNIEVGSIHFHTLCYVLKEGISRHVDYLGGGSLALGYTLLDSTSYDKKVELKNESELATLAAKAPERVPKQEDYSTSLEFLQARLAFRVANSLAYKRVKTEAETKVEQAEQPIKDNKGKEL